MTLSGLRVALCVGLGAVALTACADDGDAPYIETITEEALRTDLETLSDDSMAGRLVGSPELEGAAEWIGRRFAELELEPAGDDRTYDQRFDLAWFSLGTPNRLNVSGAGGARVAGNGWTPADFSATGSASGDVVFAGYGIVEPRLGFDDYRDGDVRGKIVLVLDREPGVDDPASPFDGVVTSEASRAWRKALSAQERGARALLIVRDVQARPDVADWPQYHRASWPDEPRRIERFMLGAWAESVDIPAAMISARLAERLVSGTGRPLVELAREAEGAPEGLGVVALPGARADLAVAVQRHVTPGHNVLGMIEGSDPVLRDQVVIVSGHYDHNGADAEDIFNGADDDGSGTVGVMAVAGAYARAARAGRRPRRSILFAVWDAEERGLLGAWYYTLQPLFPLPSTVAVLNLDMIGRNEEVPPDGGGRFNGLEVQTAESNANATNLLGYSRTPELAAAVEAANLALAESGSLSSALTLRLRYDNNESNLLRRSDHWPFLQNGVPAVWFHTGLHPDYHTPEDDADRIEYEKMARIVRLVDQASWDLANADGRPAIEGMGVRPRS